MKTNFYVEQQEKLQSQIAAYKEKQKLEQERFEFWKDHLQDANRHPEKAVEYTQHRIDSIQMNVRQRTPWAESFAEVKTFADNEIYSFRTSYVDPITVHKISSFSGAAPLIQPETNDSAVTMDFYWNESEPYDVPIQDPNFGNWEQDQENMDRAMHDIKRKRETGVKAILDNGLVTSFTDETHFKLDPDIQTGILPDGNDIDQSSEGGLTKGFFKALFEHFGRLRGVALPNPDVPLAVQRILVPVTAEYDIWDWVSIISNATGADPQETVDPETQRQIFQFGKPQNFFGNPFELEPLNTLPENYVYVSTNKPAMILGLKPGMDESWVLDDKAMLSRNRIGFMARVTEGVMQPTIYQTNYARFQYSS